MLLPQMFFIVKNTRDTSIDLPKKLKNFVAQNSIDVKSPKNNPRVGSYYISQPKWSYD